MTNSYRYFTKDALIEAAKAGNERGYNRQLDPKALQEGVKFTDFLPVTFDMLHEHINGEKVEPHMRVMVMVDADVEADTDETVVLDISMERYNDLPTFYDPVISEDVVADAGHRGSLK